MTVIDQQPQLPPTVRGLGRQTILASFKRSLGLRVYAKTLLADLATPDFSMPYNVIIMSSTLIALLFGNIFNTLARTLVIVQLDEPEKQQPASQPPKVKAD